MRLLRAVVGFAAALFVLAVLIAAFKWSQHWIAVHLGVLKAGPDIYYNFWSGFGSDLTEATLPAALATFYWHHTCHTAPWWHLRWGHQVPGTHFLQCHRCHPDHPGDRRNLPREVIHQKIEELRRSP